jgi:hypothetical protein
MPYCPKCGKEVKDDAVFCPYCGESMKPTEQVVYRRSRDEKDERDEKGEKNEKNEKNEKGEKNEGKGGTWGAIMGGLIVIWLGATFLLRSYDFFTYSQWWNVFMIGLGIILVVRGVGFYMQTSSWRASSGFLIGGAIVALIGFVGYAGVRDWWAILFILIGAWIILNAVMNRGKNPRP